MRDEALLQQQANDELSAISGMTIPEIGAAQVMALVGLIAVGIRCVGVRGEDIAPHVGATLAAGRSFLLDIRDSFEGFPALLAIVDDAISAADGS